MVFLTWEVICRVEDPAWLIQIPNLPASRNMHSTWQDLYLQREKGTVISEAVPVNF